jgi:hypothetical protein
VKKMENPKISIVTGVALKLNTLDIDKPIINGILDEKTWACLLKENHVCIIQICLME